MYDDVSVTWLSDDDGRTDRVPPPPRSRLRLLAVMGAVVVGCGVAAFAVSTAGYDEQAQPDPDDAMVIGPPTRSPGDPTSIAATLTAVSPITETGSGRADPPHTSAQNTTTEPSATGTTTSTATTTGERTSTEPSDDSTTAPTTTPNTSSPAPGNTSTTTPDPAPTTTTTEPEDDCPWWWWFC